MKYKGFYFLLFKGPMKKVLIEKYNKAYASEIITKSKKVYRELVKNMDDIGEDNPMVYNEMFALVFVVFMSLSILFTLLFGKIIHHIEMSLQAILLKIASRITNMNRSLSL